MEILEKDHDRQQSADLDRTPELDRFLPYVGEQFDVSLPMGSLKIELVEANALPGSAGAYSEDSFSLVFRAPNDCDLTLGSVAIDHDQVGWVVMFLMPIGEDQNGQYFEAVFN
jgi:hypothetical protein